MPSRLSSIFSRRQPAEPQHPSTSVRKEEKSTKRTTIFSRKTSEQTPVPPVPSLPTGDVILHRTQRRPSVPIYDSFAATSSCRSLSTHDLPYPTGAGPSRQEQSPPRVPSIADFEDFEHRRTLDLRRLPSRTKKRPKHDGHDRAAELAESYRVILPDPETMFADDDDDADDADDEVTGDDDDIVPQGGECTHCGGESLPSPQQTTPARRTSSPGSLPNMKSPSNSTSPIWATSVTSSTTTTAAAELNRQPDPQSHPYPSQDSSAGIHICTQLLADELTAALSLQWRAVGDISIDIDTYSEKEDAVTHMMQPQRSTQKVQVLLMIEAYEGVLRRCKQELQDLSEAMGRAEAGGSNDAAARKRAVRRRQVGEAVPVLEHWLETLRALYVGVFMDDAPDGGLRL